MCQPDVHIGAINPALGRQEEEVGTAAGRKREPPIRSHWSRWGQGRVHAGLSDQWEEKARLEDRGR